jgi:hypothetical protein
MGKKGGGAGDEQPKSDTKRPSSTTQQEGESISQATITHQAQQQQHQQSHTLDSATPVQTTKSQLESDRLSQQLAATTPRHQVIAVSASKGPAAFFNLARKFLVTDELCDLSALEGAIVSAVDAAHLLERSKLADIVRIQTSYVPVEPKRRPQQDASKQPDLTPVNIPPSEAHREDKPTSSKKGHPGRKGAPLRRSRIIITVKRTDDYKRWLEDNPHHATGHGDDIDDSPTQL